LKTTAEHLESLEEADNDIWALMAAAQLTAKIEGPREVREQQRRDREAKRHKKNADYAQQEARRLREEQEAFHRAQRQMDEERLADEERARNNAQWAYVEEVDDGVLDEPDLPN